MSAITEQHKAKHLVLQDSGRKYLGGIEELISYAERVVTPPFDRSEDDARDWVAIAQQQCEVSAHDPSHHTISIASHDIKCSCCPSEKLRCDYNSRYDDVDLQNFDECVKNQAYAVYRYMRASFSRDSAHGLRAAVICDATKPGGDFIWDFSWFCRQSAS